MEFLVLMLLYIYIYVFVLFRVLLDLVGRIEFAKMFAEVSAMTCSIIRFAHVTLFHIVLYHIEYYELPY